MPTTTETVTQFLRFLSWMSSFPMSYLLENQISLHLKALRGPYTINHVAQHCVLCNMIDRVWC
jgi:hypothetical protein